MWSPSQRSQHSFAGLSFSLRRLTDGGGGLRFSCDGILLDFLSSSITEEGSASFTRGDGFVEAPTGAAVAPSGRRRSSALMRASSAARAAFCVSVSPLDGAAAGAAVAGRRRVRRLRTGRRRPPDGRRRRAAARASSQSPAPPRGPVPPTPRRRRPDSCACARCGSARGSAGPAGWPRPWPRSAFVGVPVASSASGGRSARSPHRRAPGGPGSQRRDLQVLVRWPARRGVGGRRAPALAMRPRSLDYLQNIQNNPITPEDATPESAAPRRPTTTPAPEDQVDAADAVAFTRSRAASSKRRPSRSSDPNVCSSDATSSLTTSTISS